MAQDGAAAVDPRIGKILGGRYRVLSRVASGAMGVVYKGERVQLGRPVAIKFLHASFASQKEFMGRFEREARAMSRLAHPHCVSVIDFGMDDVPYVVMEFVTGPTLRDVMDDGRLPVARALHIGRQLLAGLAHAHGQGIVHRDVKPANIMLTEVTGTGDHVRILDFGLAKLRDDAAGMNAHTRDLSSAAIAVGTPSYMSPEQSRGGPVDARSDVYSAGVLLFELLTGHKPFEAEQAYELLAMHREHLPPSMRDVAPDVPFTPELEAAVRRALAKDPADRFQSAAEMAEAIEAVRMSGQVDAMDGGPAAADRSSPSTRSAIGRSTGSRRAAGKGTELPYAQTVSLSTEEPVPPELRAAPPPSRAGIRWALAGVLLAVVAAAAWWVRRDAQSEGHSRAGRSPAAAPTTPAAPTPAPVATTTPPDAAIATAVVRPEPTSEPTTEPTATATAALGDPDAAPLPPEEQGEPVAQIPEEAKVEDAKIDRPEPPPTPAPTHAARTPAPADSIPQALALIKANQIDDAIGVLQRLERKEPKSAYIPYLLGNLYFEKLYWSDGLSAYHRTIVNNPVYKSRAILNRNVIQALASNKTAARAERFIASELGRAALPYLRVAAKSNANDAIRKRAGWLVKQIPAARGGRGTDHHF